MIKTSTPKNESEFKVEYDLSKAQERIIKFSKMMSGCCDGGFRIIFNRRTSYFVCRECNKFCKLKNE